MTFPQPSSNSYTANSYEFFFLDTELSSPGDIYESDVGGHGLAVGPNSDIANVNVAYFDNQIEPTFMHTVQIGPARAFVGRVDANVGSFYAPSQRPGRILIWSGNLYDPNFRPRAFVTGDTIQFIAPRLSVLQYFSPVASLGPQRVDKEFQFQNFPATGGHTSYLVVPYYGRKQCSIRITNRNLTTAITFGVTGVTYAITDDSSPNPYHQETVIRAPGALAPNGGAATVLINSIANGMFDALVFSVNGAPAPLRIIMSDQE